MLLLPARAFITLTGKYSSLLLSYPALTYNYIYLLCLVGGEIVLWGVRWLKGVWNTGGECR